MRLIIIIFFIGMVQHAHSQKGIELGGNAGISYYFGDLNTNYNISKPGFAIELKTRKNFNERISLAAGLQYAQVQASDKNSNNNFEKARNLDFKSVLWDLNFTMEFNFFPYFHGSKDFYYTPYLFAGFSILKYNPTTELEGVRYNLREFGTEGQFLGNEYFLMSGALVYGIGFKWDINRDWSVNTQISGRKLFSDYIDDVSDTYPEFASLEASRGSTAVALSNRSSIPDFVQPKMQRGNGKSNDVLYFISIGIMKYFGQLECPSISKIPK